MKTRIMTMLAALLLISTGAFAQHVTETDALQKAQAFMQGKFEAAGGSRRAPRKMQRVPKAAENDAFYIFNAEDNGGFVIVSGDERTDEILGYSTEGNIDLDKMPENMQAWLKGYEEQINSLQSNANRAPSYVPVHPAVEPLITSKWNQGPPYNLQCPMQTPEGDTESYGCPTGCSATAMAQILYYWKCPKGMTTAIPAYDYGYVGWDKETQTGIYKYHEDALPPTTFEWDLMKDSYDGNETGAEAQAVAKLMRYCGQSIKTDYSPWGSSAGLMTDYNNCFGYAMVTATRDECYNNQEWDELIYTELAAGRPIFYSGNGTDGSHAFVCDGYDGNGLYHFNWGWGGILDGYFRLSLLNCWGDDGYGRWQRVCVGIQPSATSSKIKPEVWSYRVSAGLFGIESNGNLWGFYAYYNNHTDYLMIDGAIGLLKDDGSVEVLTTLLKKGFFENNGAEIYSECRHFDDFYETYDNVQNAPTIPNLPDGTYRLVALWKEISETEWHYNGEESKNYHYQELTVNGNHRTLESKIHDNRDDIRYTAMIEPLGNMVTDERQRFAIHCVSEGFEFQSNLNLYASQTEDMGNPIAVTPLYMDAGTEETVYMGFIPEQEGTYHVWVVDGRKNLVVAQTDVTISNRMKISTSCGKFNINTMTIPITVTNNDDVPYNREVAVRIYPDEDYGKEDRGQVFKSEKLHIEPGQQMVVDFDCTGLSIDLDLDHLYDLDVMCYMNPMNDVISDCCRTSLDWDSKSGFTVNGILYMIVDAEHHYVFAEKCYSDASQQMTIPSTVSPNDGVTYTVKGISRYFCHNSNVTSFVVSEGITTIDVDCMSECESLETIFLPGSLNRIKEGMIFRCPNLKAIYFKAKEAPWGGGYSPIYGDTYDVILYVPKGSRASYAKAFPKFTNIVEMDVEAMQPPTNTLMGDMNGDGKRSIVDVVILVNRIMEDKK